MSTEKLYLQKNIKENNLLQNNASQQQNNSRQNNSRQNNSKHKDRPSQNTWNMYIIMHGNKEIAAIYKNGSCKIYLENFMPYNLCLEELAQDDDDIDIRIQNLDNFYYWCATRMLTLDREYAKEIFNSIGASQAVTDRERAAVALSYHCLSITDIYWTKEADEVQDFSSMNLFENHLDKTFVDVSLRGKQMTITNRHLMADNLGTKGCYPKAWIRKENHFYLIKDGSAELVENELLASKICRCFDVNQVFYEEDYYDHSKVSSSRIITSLDKSIVSMEYFEIYAANHDINKKQYILNLDKYSYYMMNIIDYLIGNTDRHWGNWGLLIDNKNNEPIGLHALMDFNKAFHSYDTLEGANCLTIFEKGKVQNQKEAAIEAVKEIGLNQIEEIQKEWFGDESRRDMFFLRLNLLNMSAE